MMTINNEKEREMKDKMKTLADSLGLESVVDMATGYGSLSYFMDDKNEAKRLKDFLTREFKRVRLIPLNKLGGDTANWVVAADLAFKMHGGK